ncbi:MAG: ABC transporter substrate-binding protein [Bacilli bacterium]|nr:ABC transporter substrate-binding protein [Bacilli bacterium]
MKKIKSLLVMLVVVLLGITLTGCGGSNLIKVGILKYVSASALDSAQDGIVKALAEAGYVDGENIEIIYQNPEANPSTLTNAAISLVNECDIIFAIATPAAQAVKAEIENQGKETPLVFTAVTDPVSAGLVESVENKTGFVTGTNDMNPVAEQVALIHEIDKSVTKMGIIYTSNEVNSKIQSDLAEAKAKEMGISTYVQTINSVNDITNAINALISDGIEAIYIPTDNVVASAVPAVVNITNDHGIITVCGEEGELNDGGLISYSINYLALGELTGEMGAKILSGELAPNQIPVGGLALEDLSLVINKKAAAAANITIPEELLNKADKVVE